MNEAEAKGILAEHLEKYRKWSYAELVQLIDRHQSFKTTAPSGASYNFELQVRWEATPDGPVLVIGSINESGSPASAPLSDSFVVPSGKGSAAP